MRSIIFSIFRSPVSFSLVSVFFDRQNLRKIVTRTEELIHRKIRTLVVDENEFATLKDNLDIDHSLLIYGDRPAG